MAPLINDKANLVARRLAELRDELRVQIHLASMDARDAFEDIDPELSRMSDALKSLTENVEGSVEESDVRLHLLAMEIRDRWETLSGIVRNLVESVQQRGEATHGKLDTARVRAHLARLDAADEIERRRADIRARLREARNVVYEETAGMLDDLAQSILELHDRIKAKKTGG